jgi:hypothetical protein
MVLAGLRATSEAARPRAPAKSRWRQCTVGRVGRMIGHWPPKEGELTLIDSLDKLEQVLASAIAMKVREWDWNFMMGNVLRQHEFSDEIREHIMRAGLVALVRQKVRQQTEI